MLLVLKLRVPETDYTETLLHFDFFGRWASCSYGYLLVSCQVSMVIYKPVPQFFQLVFVDSATLAGVGLLPMRPGLGIGNPAAAWITSKYGISLANAVVGAMLEVLISGLMTR